MISWPDPASEGLGFDPRSRYTERFWLPVLGPSGVWLLRRLADGLEDEPDGFELDLDDTARALGVGTSSSRHSPLQRGIARCVRFGLARRPDERHLSVRRRLPPVERRHLFRFPLDLQRQHRNFVDSDPGADEPLRLRRRARLVALDLRELGVDDACIERHLLRRGVHPATAFEAARWAWSPAGVDDRALVTEGQAVVGAG
ncbi:MAG: hypothetical protein ACRDV6_10960 [Acidimicrobiales bacterium]